MSVAPPRVGDGDHHIPTDSLSELLPPATDLPDNLPCDAGNGDIPFGDFFFQMLNTDVCDAAGDATSGAGAGDPNGAPTMGFGDFCFDDICGADAWPAGAEPTGTLSLFPQDTSAEAPPAFGFDLPQDTSAEAPPPFGFDLPQDTSAEAPPPFGFDLPQDTSAEAPPPFGFDLPQDTSAEAPPPFGFDLPQDTIVEAARAMESDSEVRGSAGLSPSLDTAPKTTTTTTTVTAAAAITAPVTSVTAAAVTPKEQAPNRLSGKSVATNDCSMQSSSSGSATRVPKEGVEVWLHRAEQLMRDEGAAANPSATASRASPSASFATSGDGGDNKGPNSGDEAFNAQVAHWLRRGAEVQESALTTVANMQLRLTQLLRLFGAHSGLAALLDQQYATTPAVLTLPLVLPLLESLLEEE